MHATDKIFGKICRKAIRDTFFFNVVYVQDRDEGTRFLSGVISNRRGKFTFLGLQGDLPIPSLSGTSWSPHKENPDEGAWSVYCDDFEKRVFSLKSNTFTAFKVKHEKEVPNILMVFNLLKIIHPFQVKKHLRT